MEETKIHRKNYMIILREEYRKLLLLLFDISTVLQTKALIPSNPYLWRMMKVAGYTKTQRFELDEFNYEAMASHSFKTLLNEINTHLHE